MLNVPLSNVFDTLQINLGSAYVNDFNFLGRVNQVRAQADQNFRIDREDILRLKTRSATGALVPLGSLVNIRDIAGPDLVQRYNLFPTVPVQGDTRPGISSGQALDGDGAPGAEPAAGRRLRMDRARLPGARDRQHGDLHLRARGAVRVPRARGAIRELGACRSPSC